MNTTDLTAKQSTIYAALIADSKAHLDTTGAEQVARIADSTGMTKKAVDSQLRVLAGKELVIRINGVWSLVLENSTCTMTNAEYDRQQAENVSKAWKKYISKTESAELVSAELSHLSDDDRTEFVEAASDPADQATIDAAFAKMTSAVDFSDAKRITKHSSCAHAATKAARAKCRRESAKRAS